MERQGDEVHVQSTEATGASRENVVRWVLIVGLLLAIVLLSIIWMTGAAFQGDVEEEGHVGGVIRSVEDQSDGQADSVVSDQRQFEARGPQETGTAESAPAPADDGEAIETAAPAE